MSVSGGQAVNGRHSSSLEPRDFYQLKQRAAEYYRSNAVPQRMQQVLNTMFYEKPDDMYGHLVCRRKGREGRCKLFQMQNTIYAP